MFQREFKQMETGDARRRRPHSLRDSRPARRGLASPLPELFDPASHEPLTDRPWDDRRAREAIAVGRCRSGERIRRGVRYGPRTRSTRRTARSQSVASLYLGASGVIWAFHELEHAGLAELQRDWAPVAVRLAERYPAQPGFPGPRLRAGAVAPHGRGRDPARRAHPRPGRVAGGAAARGGAGERRQPLARADVGIARDDDRRPRAGRANGSGALAAGVARVCGAAVGAVAGRSLATGSLRQHRRVHRAGPRLRRQRPRTRPGRAARRRAPHRARAAGDRDRDGLRRAQRRCLPVAPGAPRRISAARSRSAPSGATARPGWSPRWPRSPRTTSS